MSGSDKDLLLTTNKVITLHGQSDTRPFLVLGVRQGGCLAIFAGVNVVKCWVCLNYEDLRS